MYTKKIKLLLIFLAVFSQINLNSIERYTDPDMIKSATTPIYMPDGVIITLPPDIGQTVFIRTDMDNWRSDFYFNKSFYGIYYIKLKYPQNSDRILFRINADGFWLDENAGSDSTTDKFGTQLAIRRLPAELANLKKDPVIENFDERLKHVTFQFYSPDATEVNLVCSTNNFSIINYSMQRDSKGYWQIKLPMGCGEYFYYFLENGKKRVDINNPARKFDSLHGQLSVVTVR